MATKPRDNQPESERLQAAKIELDRQRGETLDRLAAIDRELADLQQNATAADVGRLAGLLAEQTACNRVADLLASQAANLEARYQEAARIEREQAALEAIRAAAALVPGIVKATVELDRLLAEYFASVARVGALGGSRPMTIPAGLYQAARWVVGEYWPRQYPQLLGLPPSPTARELAIAEARAKLEAAEDRRKAAKDASLPGARFSVYDDARLIEWREAIPVSEDGQQFEYRITRENPFDFSVRRARERLQELDATTA